MPTRENRSAEERAHAGTGATGVAQPARRVLVAVDPARVRVEPLELAAQLAREGGVEVSALLIEDQSFVSIAALPFTRELHLSSGEWCSFDLVDVERGFREMARRAEQLIGDVSRRHGVRYSIHVERGSFPRRALELAASADTLIVDRASHGSRAAGRGYRQVAALFDGSAGAARALATAARLALASGRVLRVVVAADTVERYAQLRLAARALVAQPASAIEFVWLGSEDAGNLERLRDAVRDGETTLLVIADDAEAVKAAGASQSPPTRQTTASAQLAPTAGARPADVAGISRTIRCTVLVMR